jgi:acyl-coenzyme A thioesterase PaaI-like protein
MRIRWKPERIIAISASAILSGSLVTAAYSMKDLGKAESRWSDATVQYNDHQPYYKKLPVPSILTPNKVQCAASNKPSAWPLVVSSDYFLELVPIPARAKESSHVIFGLLLAKDQLEKYDIYKIIGDTDELIVARISVGKNLDGHTGIVHGGILALLMDDLMGIAFHVMGIPMAFTANLNIDYRTPVMANSQVVVRIKCKQREGRKLYFVAQMTSPDNSVLYVEASSLYIVPKEQPSILGKLSCFVGL